MNVHVKWHRLGPAVDWNWCYNVDKLLENYKTMERGEGVILCAFYVAWPSSIFFLLLSFTVNFLTFFSHF